ncbi:MAG: hypothetical protein LUC90_10945, partial [Lachnospiraceae bacterium]|nr:hypothetical protein [Lachnospiraceae bacterium]
MGNKQKLEMEEESFIKSHHIEELYARAKSVDPQLWPTLMGVAEHYKEYANFCQAIVQNTVVQLLNEENKGIHSVRSRVKEVDSLLEKIVKKKAYLSQEPQDDYEIEKYRPLNEQNYYKIITDSNFPYQKWERSLINQYF